MPNSIPILHFGDIEAYARSGLKIITVGLNPSLAEFSKNEDRFGHEVCESLNPATLRLALSSYFRINPYRRWFNRSYEPLLQHLGASFYGDKYPINIRRPAWWNPRRNTVLHTDLCTPLATSPTWSKLKQDEKEHFRKNGTPLWRDLAKMLEPSVIHISVPDDQVPQGLRDLSWRPFRPAENAEDEEMRSATFGNANIVWARSGRAPFFYLNRDHWETAAAEILRGLSR